MRRWLPTQRSPCPVWKRPKQSSQFLSSILKSKLNLSEFSSEKSFCCCPPKQQTIKYNVLKRPMPTNHTLNRIRLWRREGVKSLGIRPPPPLLGSLDKRTQPRTECGWWYPKWRWIFSCFRKAPGRLPSLYSMFRSNWWRGKQGSGPAHWGWGEGGWESGGGGPSGVGRGVQGGMCACVLLWQTSKERRINCACIIAPTWMWTLTDIRGV